ncbi:MAG: MFS transporter [Deinococcales bacterium]
MSLQSVPSRPSFLGVWFSLSSQSQRHLLVLFAAQGFSSGAITVSTSLSSIIIFNITGAEALAGLPSTINFFVSAVAAYWIGRLMQLYGRRSGLMLGYGMGALGAVLAATMALEKNLIGFLLGGAMLGAANGAIAQAKYAAAELVDSHVRGTIIGALVTGSAFGSVLSWATAPLIYYYAKQNQLPSIELGWYLGGFWLLLGFLLLAVAFFPKPISQISGFMQAAAVRTWKQLWQVQAVRLALLSMTLGQMVMTSLMVLMPLHAKHLGHEDSATGLISVHILGMFAFSWLTGRLVDLWGRARAIRTGAGLLMFSAFVAVFATRPLEMGFSLFVLGLGWNFCNVAGSTLLTDQLEAHERPSIQGAAELITWLAAAIGALGGGFIVGAFGFEVVSLVALLVGALPLFGTWFLRTHQA